MRTARAKRTYDFYNLHHMQMPHLNCSKSPRLSARARSSSKIVRLLFSSPALANVAFWPWFRPRPWPYRQPSAAPERGSGPLDVWSNQDCGHGQASPTPPPPAAPLPPPRSLCFRMNRQESLDLTFFMIDNTATRASCSDRPPWQRRYRACGTIFFYNFFGINTSEG